MEFELRIFDKLSEYLDNYLTDSGNAAIRDDRALFAALVQARVAQHERITYLIACNHVGRPNERP